MNDIIVRPSAGTLDYAKAGSAGIPILTVFSSQSAKFKEDPVKMAPHVDKINIYKDGAYHLVGAEVDAVYVANRVKATCYKDGEFSTAYIEVRSGNDVAKFNEFYNMAKNNVQGYKFGPEFLFYLPEWNEFVTYFTGTIADRGSCGSRIVDAVKDDVVTFSLTTKKLDGKNVKYPRTIIEANRADLEYSFRDEEQARAIVENFFNVTPFVSDPGDARS